MTAKMLLKLLENFRKEIPEVKLEDITCVGCPIAAKCEVAFDIYNYKGDCLAEK